MSQVQNAHNTICDKANGTKTNIVIYTAHEKFMNDFACHGFDPYVAIISTSRCQKTPVCKSPK